MKSKKNKAIEDHLDEMSLKHFGRKRSECLEELECVVCGESVEEQKFKTSASLQEFFITATCQDCQDNIEGHYIPETTDLWC